MEACQEAITLNPKLADAHKWFAILIGSRGVYQPIKDRVADGHLFKKHLDIALELNPMDYALHHMLGRFDFNIVGFLVGFNCFCLGMRTMWLD